MDEQKKSALDVLIDFFVEYSKDNVKPKNCAIAQYCGECGHGKDCSKCREQLREYAKEQATIPDGWDVVKEIYENVGLDDQANVELIDRDDKHKIRILENKIHNLLIKIKEQLKQAEIEV